MSKPLHLFSSFSGSGKGTRNITVPADRVQEFKDKVNAMMGIGEERDFAISESADEMGLEVEYDVHSWYDRHDDEWEGME